MIIQNPPRCTHKKKHTSSKTSECLECGNNFIQPICRLNKFCNGWCSRRYRSKHYSGENSSKWKGGIMSQGYKRVGKSSNRKLEHRVVMEGVLGRKLLSNEWVHHINGDKLDNRPENLIVVLPDTHFSDIICPNCSYHFLIK